MNRSFVPTDQATRTLAIEKPLSNLSIEAGAGTGKTTLLAHRYVNAILEHKIPMSACVAITFTEKAAQELKQRIRALLLEKDQGALAQEVYTAPISTIHAFCSHMLHQKPFAARLDPHFSQLDPLQQNRFLDECFDNFLNQQLNLADQDLAQDHPSQVILRFNVYDISIKKVKSLCLEAYQHRQFFTTHHVQNIQWPNLPQFIASLASSYEKLFELAKHACTNQEDLAYINLQKNGPWLQHLQSQGFSQQLTALLFEIKISASKGAQKNWENPKDLKYIKETLGHLKKQHEQFIAQLGHCIAQDTLHVLKAFVVHVEQEKQNLGLLDFDDLLTRTLSLLNNEAAARNYFQNQYRCFFVDEFQDTDPIQKQIIWLLSKMHETNTHNSTFIVGDPKQSIYRFRGASLETYALATQDFKHNQQHLPIVQNFRSSKKILDWINLSFDLLLAQDYHPLQALPSHHGQDHSIIVLDPVQSQLDLKAQDVKQAEARCIAQYILSVLNNDQTLIFDKPSQSYRKALANDIALIYPTSTGLDELEESLRKHGIAFLSQSSRSFFKRSEIEGLVHILQALSKPSDAIALSAALKSCYLALSDHALLELFEKNHFSVLDLDTPAAWTSYSASTQASLRVLQACRKYMLDTPNYRLSDLLNHIIEHCYVFAVLALRTHHAQAQANVKKLLLLAQYYEQNISPYIQDFAQWCLSTQDSRHDLAEASIDTKDINAVHLMTMHKAKGLEFPIVIMCQLSGKAMPYPSFLNHPQIHKQGFGFKHSDSSIYTHEYANMLKYEKNALLQEKKRLLYVACTRAKDTLVISRFKSGNYKDSFQSLLDPVWQKTEHLITSFTEEPEIINSEASQNLQKKVPQKTPPAAHVATPIFAQYKHFTEQQRQFAQLMQENYAQESPKTEAKNLHAFMASMQKSRFGTQFHKIMQDLAEQRFDVTQLAGILNHHQIVHPEQQKNLTALLQKTLDHPLIKRAQAASICMPEYPLLSRSDHGDAQSMFIDLLFKDEKGWVLLDYKTDDLKQTTAQEKSKLYTTQIKNYIENLHTQHKLVVAEAYILFIQTQQSVQV